MQLVDVMSNSSFPKDAPNYSSDKVRRPKKIWGCSALNILSYQFLPELQMPVLIVKPLVGAIQPVRVPHKDNALRKFALSFSTEAAPFRALSQGCESFMYCLATVPCVLCLTRETC